MNFDLSKENIQPLRGGRNASQLSLALQAESSEDMRRELQHQREIFENAIKSYQGDDPLENWYAFITWVEQSYPKNGHEGNLIQLLENCLKLYENDSRYTHDRRFCKLWIKYIDFQQNPLELYQMMHAKGLAVGCADMYIAWAYYHEAAGDFKGAVAVFDMGRHALAQPREDLEIAEQNLVMSAGKHFLFGKNDEHCLLEKRQALTSLHSTKSGKVGSYRVVANPSAGVYPSTSENPKLNCRHVVYHDQGDEVGGAAAAPVSILTAVRREEAPKENMMKPGRWTTMPLKKKMAVLHSPPFKVHVDDEVTGASSNTNTPHQLIDLNRDLPNFPPETKESFDNWIVNMKLPEPVDNKMVPMYPKSRVYADPTTEYSLEEFAALRYQKMKQTQIEQQKPILQTHFQQPRTQLVFPNSSMNLVHSPLNKLETIQPSNSMETAEMPSCSNTSTPIHQIQRNFLKPPTPIGNFGREKQADSSGTGRVSQFTIWTSPQEAQLQEVQPKGSAMKTPFKILTDDDLAETGSRGSMDIANAAQPMDSANINPCFDEDGSNSPFNGISSNVQCSDFNNSCNTQLFEINLNDMKVSTPQPKQHFVNNCFGDVGSTKKTLFEDDTSRHRRNDVVFEDTASNMTKNNNGLFTILEESKSYKSSSSSSGATTKSFMFSSKPAAMTTISEEHNSYLAQNSMANEALRKSLLGELLTSQSSPVMPMQDSPLSSPSFASVNEMNLVSDPFSSAEIEKMLRLVAFPGPHVPECYSVNSIPRFSMKKETVFVGMDQYFIEKVLGKGSYGTVFKAIDMKHGSAVALKYQKPANKWEFYICREIQNRLHSSLMFMNVTCGYFSDNASVLVYDFMPHGSLLDLANQYKVKMGKPLLECLCFYFCIQMLQIVEALHRIQIIHADIKPDNFLIKLIPKNMIDLQLIDFGCSIDMSLYPPNTFFTKQVTTENFMCCEMMENKPWNYHTDLFCVAATAHVLLFDKYIDLQKKYDAWFIKEKFPRYMNSDLWNRFFNVLLNQQSEAESLTNLLNDALSSQYDKFTSNMKSLVNLVKDR